MPRPARRRDTACTTVASTVAAALRGSIGDDGGVSSSTVLDALQELGRGDQLVHLERFAARPGHRQTWPQWADPEVVAAYRTLGIEEPWQHQVRAADHAWQGQHTVIATPTASGKSLAAWLPALTAARNSLAAGKQPAAGRISGYHPDATTLYLSPTKALAADQLAGLQRLLSGRGLGDVRAGTCDGDTPHTERDWVRAHAHMVLTNPDFLHFSLLPGHRWWRRLLTGLRFIVVDECHAYRGVMGAHVALVLRRLLRLAETYGARPTVICASATTGAPRTSAARLIGVPDEQVAAIVEGTAEAGQRSVALWQPGLVPPSARRRTTVAASPADEEAEPGLRHSTLQEATELLVTLVRNGARSLLFLRSRAAAEIVADEARQRLGTLGERVAAYRGGYLPEERRALESALREGHLLGLATTNALELGLDIAGLDAVVIAGWPGSRVSLWQQAGRAGRGAGDGVAVLVAGEDPLDTYVIHHPEVIFSQGVEETTFDPSNPYVLGPHLCAAAAEAPLREADLARFGLGDALLLEELGRRGLLRRRPTGWFWNFSRPESPASLTDLRGGQGPPVPIVEESTGTVLGTVDAARADATVHPGAVYVHQGQHFLVHALGDDAALVSRRPTIRYRTRARSHSSVRILGVGQTQHWQHPGGSEVSWSLGTVEVTSRVTGFDRLLLPELRLEGQYPLDRPERVLQTSAVWWSASEEALREAGVGRDALPGALHAAEHAAIGLLPIVASCDRWDLGGLSAASHEGTGQPTVFVHDGTPGGAGFAERGFRSASRWLSATLSALSSCPCEEGCPSCVQSPKCGSLNSPLDKQGATRLLTFLVAALPRQETPGEE